MNRPINRKRWEILGKYFSPEFMEKMKISPLARQTGEMLVRGASPFSIIEDLINIHENFQKEVESKLRSEPWFMTVSEQKEHGINIDEK